MKIIFALLVLGIFLPTGKTMATDDSFSCDLKTEAPVGELMDSIADLSFRFLDQIEIISNQAMFASNNARNLIKAHETCNPLRCASSCEIKPSTYSPCNTACKNGYTCDFVNSGNFNTDYPLGRSLVNNVKNCGTMNAFHPDSETRYAKFSWKKTGTVGKGFCYNLACVESKCEANKCQGDACDFALITGSMNGISAAKNLIDQAYTKINNLFELKVTELPIFGAPCLPPFMIIHPDCKSCNNIIIPPYNFNTCSEIGYLFKITERTKENISNCSGGSNLNDLFDEEVSLESLWRCQDVSPYPVDNCYKNNFFCCLLK